MFNRLEAGTQAPSRINREHSNKGRTLTGTATHNPGIEWERGHAADEGVDATTHQLRQMHLEQPLKRGRGGWAKSLNPAIGSSLNKLEAEYA